MKVITFIVSFCLFSSSALAQTSSGLLQPMTVLGNNTLTRGAARPIPIQSAGVGRSVKDYGAVCDGVTDDASAIQSAINSNKWITFPVEGCVGAYVINTTVDVPAGRSLIGVVGAGGGVNGTAIKTTSSVTTLQISGSAVSISGLSFTHSGAAGLIIRNLQNDAIDIVNNSFWASAAGNTNPVIRTAGSTGWIRENRFTNQRTDAFTIYIDRSSGHISIENHIELNYFGGVGKGILIASSDNSGRPEGVFITNNTFINTNVNLYVEQILQLTVTSNVFDQGNSYQVHLKPSGPGIEGVQFTGNYFSTPNQPTNGISIYHDNANPASPLTKVGIVNNMIAYTGYGIVLYSAADAITINDNQFVSIGTNSIQAQNSKRVTITNNTMSASSTNNINLSDGSSGGPFIVDANQFDPSGAVTFTKTTPSKFKFGSENTGKQLAGWSSLCTNSTSNPTGSYLSIPHGLASTPDPSKIIVNLITNGLVVTPGPTLAVTGITSTYIYVQVFYAQAVAGNYCVNAYASM